MKCAKCERPNLGKDDFYKASRGRSGLQSWCKVCSRESVRGTQLRTRYKLTVDQYDSLLQSQGGLCANKKCDNSWISSGKRLHVDHDHKTGTVRGLLCQFCNQALGFLRDKADALRGLADYIEVS